MANYDVISMEPISSPDVLEHLKKKAKEAELTYREQKTEEHLKKIKTMAKSSFDKALKELEELKIPRLEDKHLIKILEVKPKNGPELRAVVSHSGTVIVDDSVNKILAVLAKHK